MEIFRATVTVVPTFLSDLAAHCGGQARQVRLLHLVGAVRDGEGPIVERVGALGVAVAATLPALDTVTWDT